MIVHEKCATFPDSRVWTIFAFRWSTFRWSNYWAAICITIEGFTKRPNTTKVNRWQTNARGSRLDTTLALERDPFAFGYHENVGVSKMSFLFVTRNHYSTRYPAMPNALDLRLVKTLSIAIWANLAFATFSYYYFSMDI